MPVFNFACPGCGAYWRRLLDTAPEEPPCCAGCGVPSERVMGGPTARVVERLDTGIMAKAVERLAEGPRMIRERNRAKVEADKPPVLVEKLGE